MKGHSHVRKWAAFCMAAAMFYVAASAGMARAQNAGAGGAKKFGLFDCISWVLDNRAELKEAHSRTIEEEKALIERLAEFDPVLSAALNRTFWEQDAGTVQGIVNGSKFVGDVFSLEWRRELMTGGTVKIRHKESRKETVSSWAGGSGKEVLYEEIIALDLEKPLMGGRGQRYALNALYIQEKNIQLEALDYLQSEADLILQTVEKYIAALQAREQVAMSKASVRHSAKLLDAAWTRFDAGTLSEVDRLEAESELAVQKADLMTAEIAYQNRLAELKHEIGMEQIEDLDILPLEGQPLDEIPKAETVIDAAMAERPESTRMQILLETVGLKMERALSDYKPTLNVQGTFGLQGENEGLKLFKDLINKQWFFGLMYEKSLNGNRGALSQIDQLDQQKEQILLQADELLAAIGLQAYNTLREIQAANGRIEAYELSRKTAEERLKAEQERFEIGYSSVLDAIQAERRLAEMNAQYNEAVLDLAALQYRLKSYAGQLNSEKLPQRTIAVGKRTHPSEPLESLSGAQVKSEN